VPGGWVPPATPEPSLGTQPDIQEGRSAAIGTPFLFLGSELAKESLRPGPASRALPGRGRSATSPVLFPAYAQPRRTGTASYWVANALARATSRAEPA
jgi:hypothetical protein